MNDHVNSERPPETLEKIVTEAIEDLGKIKARVSVTDAICAIDIATPAHGFAIQDALNGMRGYSTELIDDCIETLEAVLEASKEATS